MDRETALVFYRALMMICRYFEKRYDIGKPAPSGDYDMIDKV